MSGAAAALRFVVAGTFTVAVARAQPAKADTEGDGAQRRHRLGLQVGGSSVFQVAYRYRFAGPIHLDVGALGVPHSPVNFSAGLVVGSPVAGSIFPYAGLGVGHAGIERNRGGAPGCYPDMPGCPTQGDYLFFAYARAGVGVALDAARRHTLGLDVGGWWGAHQSRYNDGAGVQTVSVKRILWPMAGASYFVAFH